MSILLQNAAQTIAFVMTDNAGLEVPGLGAAFNLFISKNGGIFAPGMGVKSEIGQGWYAYQLTAGETDTPGVLAVYITGAGCVQQNLAYIVRDLAGLVWSHLSRTLTVSLADFHLWQGGQDIEVVRGDTFIVNLIYLGDLSARSKLWLTVKEDKDTPDNNADVQIEETGGLLYINKVAAGVPANASIVVTNAAAGNLTITLAAVETARLDTTGNFMYDIQMLTAAGVVTTLRRGKCKIVGDITRAVT